MTPAKVGKLLKELYDKLWQAFGPQGWWPGETPFEVAVGAILTQNTNWGNVARAIAALKDRDLLSPQALHDLPEAELAGLIRPAGYYNLKARRLKNFLALLQGRYQGSMEVMAGDNLEVLRHRLLEVKGIGPETADSILLYALNKPTFVVDAYTFRILSRHRLLPETCTYEELRRLFMDNMAADLGLYQEYHALLVRVGKEFCRPKPRCESCWLEGWP
ncbi:MAG: endonuclease III domain-containing protein [Deltaproteobacteria bacterium]|nr:endonuclease III domain-containing protein [Deltaproteobacteria bacterium]